MRSSIPVPVGTIPKDSESITFSAYGWLATGWSNDADTQDFSDG